MIKRRKNIVLIMALIMLSIAVYYIYNSLFSISSGLKTPRRRAATLSKLIRRNSIHDLPKDFSYEDDEDVIQNFTIKDKNGAKYHWVLVTYPVGVAGHRAYSFIFNSDWKCLLKSEDSLTIDNGSMNDYTGDGYVEKIFVYDIAEKDGRGDETINYDGALQVWRLKPQSPELLLDVRYKRGVSTEGNWLYQYSIVPTSLPSDDGYRIELTILGQEKNETLVTFLWSQEKHKFICSGPLEPKLWKVLKN